jgi:nucleoside-triphosphatase THEP1
MQENSKIYIITGGKMAGKTTLLGNVVKLLQEHELETRGFLSEMIAEKPDKPEYFLTNINTGNQQLLCSTEEYPGWEKLGRFCFNPIIVEMGNEILLDKIPPLPDFFIIDEVGKLETEGNVWDKVVKTLLQTEHTKCIWTTRDNYLNEVVSHYGLVNYRIFEAGEITADEIVRSILSI